MLQRRDYDNADRLLASVVILTVSLWPPDSSTAAARHAMYACMSVTLNP